MYLRGLSLQNFRSFRDETNFENLKNLIILIGPNGAGKSNFLKALTYLRNIFNGQEQPFADIVFDHDTSKKISVKIEWELTIPERQQIISRIDDSKFHVFKNVDLEKNQIFKFIKFNVVIEKNLVENEQLYFSDEKGNPILYISGTLKGNQYRYEGIILDEYFSQNNSLSNLSSTSRITILNGSKSNRPLNGISGNKHNKFDNLFQNFFEQMKLFPAHRAAQTSLKSGEDHNLEGNGSNLVRVLNTKYVNSPQEFNRINEVFQKLSRNAKISSPLRGDQVTVDIKEDGLSKNTNINDMSTGFEQSLILLSGVETSGENQLICIEEPEIHLHSDSQRELFNAIREKAKTHQFIITTHSPIFTTIEENVKTFLISKLEGYSLIYEIKDKENLKIIKEQLGLRHSDIYDNDAVIFIEGESEYQAFPIVSESLGFLQDGSYKLFNLKGRGNLKNIKQLLDYLQDSDRNLYLILDNNSEVKNDVNDLDRAGYIPKNNIHILEKDFEDLFESDRIIRALKKVYNGKTEIKLSKEDLEQQRQSKKVAKIVDEYLQQNHSLPLTKPALAKELAQDISEEINMSLEHKQEGTETRTETEFEKIIKDCMSCVGISSIYAPQHSSL